MSAGKKVWQEEIYLSSRKTMLYMLSAIPSSNCVFSFNLRMDFSVSNPINYWEGIVAKHRLALLPLAHVMLELRYSDFSFEITNYCFLYQKT